jgi:hypothetical protein
MAIRNCDAKAEGVSAWPVRSVSTFQGPVFELVGALCRRKQYWKGSPHRPTTEVVGLSVDSRSDDELS